MSRVLYEQSVQQVNKCAAMAAELTKPASTHILRRSFATPMLQPAYGIRSIQELLGHTDAANTMSVRRNNLDQFRSSEPVVRQLRRREGDESSGVVSIALFRIMKGWFAMAWPQAASGQFRRPRPVRP